MLNHKKRQIRNLSISEMIESFFLKIKCQNQNSSNEFEQWKLNYIIRS